jgi:hypothetical protein
LWVVDRLMGTHKLFAVWGRKMPKSKPSYGQDTQDSARSLVEKLFRCAKENRSEEFEIFKCQWFDNQKILDVETELRYLIQFLNEKSYKQLTPKQIKNEVARINYLLSNQLGNDFLRICHKPPQKGKKLQSFTLTLWSDTWEENKKRFDVSWKEARNRKQENSISKTKDFGSLLENIKKASQDTRKRLNPYYLERINRLDNDENNYIEAINRSVNSQKAKVIFIYAPAGYGKSVLLGEIYDKLVHEVGWIALTLSAYLSDKKLDSVDSFAKALGESIGNQEQSINEITIKLNSECGKGVLLIDTLDLILTQTFIPSLREVLIKLLNDGVTVVFTCREEEYNSLKSHHTNLRDCDIDDLRVKEFSDAEIRQATLTFIEIRKKQLEKNQGAKDKISDDFSKQIFEMTAGDCKPSDLKKIIQSPLLLGMLCNLFSVEGRVPENFTVSNLYDKYWLERIISCRENETEYDANLREKLCLLIAKSLFNIFQEDNKFQESIKKLDLQENWSRESTDTLNKLIGGNVLEWVKTDRSEIRFFHQTFLEYVVARWLELREARTVLEKLLHDLADEDWAYKRIFWYTIIRQLLTRESYERFEDIRQQLNINQLPAFNAVVFAAASRDNPDGLEHLLKLGLELDSPSHEETLRKAIASVPIQLANPAYDFIIKMMETGQIRSAVNAAKSASTMIAQWWDLLSPRIDETLNAIGKSETGRKSEILGCFLGELKELLSKNLDANIMQSLRCNYDLLGTANRSFLIQLHLSLKVPKEERIKLIKILVEKTISNNSDIEKDLLALTTRIFYDDPCLSESIDLMKETWLTTLISQIKNTKLNNKWNGIYNKALSDYITSNVAK